MSMLLQVSDTHFGTEKPVVVEALVALSKELAPDLLVLSGDLTQRARAAQFGAAAAFVKRLAVPHVLAIPGNHDIPLFNVATRILDPYRGYRRAFGDEFEPRHGAPDCLVLGVKTTRRYRHVDGEISDAQRARVATELRGASSNQVRIVVTHQPVAVPRESEEHNVAHGGKEAARAWAEAGADVILAGHIHLPFVLPLHESLGPLPRALWAVNAGTAVSRRTRHDAGNSVNVLRVASQALDATPSCRVERWTFDATAGAFVRSVEVSLRIGPL